MVLNELGAQLTKSLATLSQATHIDEKVLDSCLKEISIALMQADVNIRLINNLRNGIKKRVNLEQLAAGLNKQRVIEKAVFDELCDLLDSGGVDPKKLEPKKGKTHVVMFVGLQGSGKTTTCTKYAYYYKRKNWKPALVCADTFRAGAFDQVSARCSARVQQRIARQHIAASLALARFAVPGPEAGTAHSSRSDG